VLAYVFWHVPAAGVEPVAYEARLARFHAALRAAGVGPTSTLGLASVPWLGGGAGYEDWYLVEDFATLGELAVIAVTGSRSAPHDAAAADVGAGVAGVMAHVAGEVLLPAEPAWAAWTGKPAGMAYAAFHAELAATLRGHEASAWQRQMVLGPASEYCVLAAEPLSLAWPAQAWPVRTVVAPLG
jgi:hypothetical protein